MTTVSEWPRIELDSVPRLEMAKELADKVYQSCRLEDLETEEAFARMYELGRFDLKEDKFVDSSLLGLLTTNLEKDNTFNIRIDCSDERRNHIISHEIGHSFFCYRGDKRPRRIEREFSYSDYEKEEEFCNEFASQLLKLIQKNDNRD